MADYIGSLGSKDIVVASGESLLVRASVTSATISKKLDTVEFPDRFIPDTTYPEITNQTVLISTAGTYRVQENGGTGLVTYDVGASPALPPDGYQGAPTAATVTATLTAAEVLAGIITVDQGGSAATAQTLPLATAMDTALPSAEAGFSFDFSVINISTDAAEDCTMTTNTGWTLVGAMIVASNAAATDKSAGLFRARKTAAGAWSLYRLS
ncbi:hypothetical protein N9917_02380 [Deltaproteobacteria bacterium]|nr:hypothetical protein [Deltaproteobacteria bacterium]